jgi:alpha-amylase/alpha-mannosidase (GH57 family)
LSDIILDSEKGDKDAINVAFLWHQHQPYYKNDDIYFLPWVRFHGTKDYYDMVRILDDYPTIKQTFNLVPSLLVQIEDYIYNHSRDKVWIISSKDPDELTDEDKSYILKNFFNCYHERMVYPYPRYAELLKLRGENYEQKNFYLIKDKFTYQDWFDLQVWYNFVWIGEYSKYDEPFKRIIAKGKDFNQEDKNIVLNDSIQILKKIISKHKSAQEEGRIEVSISPFYHPILPLLCDIEVAKICDPNVILPSNKFKHPEDAEAQIQKSIEYYTKIFGQKPKGLWPSEGSVSEKVLDILIKYGFNWTATDELILYNTLNNGLADYSLFKPYKYINKNGRISLVFRDHKLSDLIGFTYSKWNPDDAAKDFINHIHKIRDGIIKQNKFSVSDSLIAIILDGENCWEYYQSDGKDFLRTLYWMLSNDKLIKTTTINDFVDSKKESSHSLTKLFPGSWINGNFKIWVGHNEDNLAWDLLSMTRDFLVEKEKSGLYSSEIIKAAWEEIFIAEGSDWNWWYGDEHHSTELHVFDEMFRIQLANVYRLLGYPVPEILTKSIKSEHEKIKIIQPKGYIYPVIDGKLSFENEWKLAGIFETTLTGGVMHKVSNPVRKIYFGYNEDNIFIRVDCSFQHKHNCRYMLRFIEPFEIEMDIKPSGFEISWKKDSRIEIFSYSFGAASSDFLEIFLSRKEFNIFDNSYVSFEILLFKENSEIERIPEDDLIRFKIESKKSLEYRE